MDIKNAKNGSITVKIWLKQDLGLNCEKTKLPGVYLQETEDLNLITPKTQGLRCKKTRVGRWVQNVEIPGAKLKEKGLGSNYFSTAEGPACKT